MSAAVNTDTRVETICGLLKSAASAYGEKPCIRYRQNGETVTKTYNDLYRDSLARAAYFSSFGLKGSNIAIIGKTTYGYLVCLNAVILSGNTAVPVANDLPRAELLRLLKDCDADGVIYDGTVDLSGKALQRMTRLRFRSSPDAVLLNERTDAAPALTDEPEQVAVIMYSSGTTGEKKGVMLTSSALVSNVSFREMDFAGSNVALNVLPMHHIFSFSCDYLKNIKDGVTICICSGVAHLGEELLLYEPTVLRLVPMMVESLMRRVRILRKRQPSLSPRAACEKIFGRNLRNIIVSGASYAAQNDREFEEMGVTVRQGYGMTEAGPRIAVPDGKTCAESGGRVISICDVRIRDGEIQVKSPSLMKGYYKRDEETRAMFTPDGWLRTGDMGRLTPDRELFITGRLKNIIVLSNGENVSPEEIEGAYADEELVSEIEVFEDDGVIAADIYPDVSWARQAGIGDIAAAVTELVRHKNAEFPAAREIDRVNVRETPLPKTDTGKIKRRKWTT